MTEIVLNEVNVPFQALTANLKFQLRLLEKKHNKENNEVFNKIANQVNSLNRIENLRNNLRLINPENVSADEIEKMRINVEKETQEIENSKDYQSLMENISLIDMVENAQKGNTETMQAVMINFIKEENEIKHLIEYVRACVDTKTAKKNKVKVYDVINNDDFWLDVPLKQLQEIKESFRK